MNNEQAKNQPKSAETEKLNEINMTELEKSGDDETNWEDVVDETEEMEFGNVFFRFKFC